MVCLRRLFLMMMTQPGPQYSQAKDLLVHSRLMTEQTDAYWRMMLTWESC